jgi:hypothetical protein
VSSIRDMLGIKPGEANRLALERELKRRAEEWAYRPGYLYRGSAELLLRHGEFFVGRPIPEEYEHLVGQMGGCFDNAATAAEQCPELRYFQGLYSTGGAHFTPHGWCVAPDGGVVEVTWPTRNLTDMHNKVTGFPVQEPDRVGYWGIEIRPELMRWCFERWNNQCLLDRPSMDLAMDAEAFAEADDLPLLRHPYNPTRVSF